MFWQNTNDQKKEKRFDMCHLSISNELKYFATSSANADLN